MSDLSPNRLPKDWKKVPSPRALKEIGHEWIKTQVSAVLQVPSIIIPEESNYILNPFHPDFNQVELKEIRPYNFDERIL